MINIEREFKLLKNLSFERLSGTKEELKAADLIIEALKQIKLDGKKEAFDTTRSEIKQATFEVLEPYKQTINVSGYMHCKDTDKNGLVGELYYLEDDSEVSIKGAKGKIVLYNGYIGKIGYKNILKAGAIGFISFNGHIDMDEDKIDLDNRELRKPDDNGAILPGVNMKVHDALAMVEKGATKVKMHVQQKTIKVKSHNVVCDIKGYEDEETVCFTAHYDSVPFSKGPYDNGTGSVCLYELAAYFKDHQPRRNLRFIWCGSEERGLLGSLSYCEEHQAELEKTVLCINVDMIGCTLGKRIAVATSDISLVNYVDYLSKEIGFPIKASQGVYSSDSTPFADNGVPAISFARITPAGGGDIHSRYDLIEHLSSKYLEEDTNFILEFSNHIVNAYVSMVPRTMPDNMKEELNKYQRMDKTKNKEVEEKKIKKVK